MKTRNKTPVGINSQALEVQVNSAETKGVATKESVVEKALNNSVGWLLYCIKPYNISEVE